MPDHNERIVRVEGIKYRDPRGVWRFGLRGVSVKVHPDYLEQFDSRNGDPPRQVSMPEPVASEPESTPPVQEPDAADPGH